MTPERKFLRRAFFALAAAAFIAMMLRLYTYWKEVGINDTMFRTDGTACLIYNVMGFTVFALCLFFSLRKGPEASAPSAASKPKRPVSGLFTDDTVRRGPAAPDPMKLPSFAAQTAVWHGTLSAFLTFLPGFGFLSFAYSLFRAGLTSDPYQLIFALLSVLSGAWFLYAAVRRSDRKSRLRPFFALAPAFWCTLRMVVEYRDLARFVNKPLYIGQFLFIISALLFFLYQAQLLFGEPLFHRPYSYGFAALAAAFFGVTCRLPHLIAVLGDRISADLVDASSLFIDLALTLYVLVKVMTVLNPPTEDL